MTGATCQQAALLPPPELPEEIPFDASDSMRAIFWRTAWLGDIHNAMELRKLSFKLALDFTNRELRAMNAGALALHDEARASLRSLIAAGGLLYAWVPDVNGCPA